MNLETALEVVAEYSDGDRLEGLKRHIDPMWIEEALAWSGTVTLRRRRLPSEQVLWLAIGMGLMRNAPIERVVDQLELALPDRKGTLVAKSAISQARQRLGEDPLAYLFTVSAAEWSGRSADAHRWRGLALYGMDGTTMRVADSPENRAAFGGQSGPRGESGYPSVRAVAMMALRSHVFECISFRRLRNGRNDFGARDMERSP